MAPTTSYTNIVLGFVCLMFLLLHIVRRNKNSTITNWPIVGMLPGALKNLPRLNEFVTELLHQNGGTFEFKGPWFCNLDLLVTSDPMNMHHVSSKRFENYPKGPEFKKAFEPLFGDGILAIDSDPWRLQRKMIHSFLKNPNFVMFFEETVQEKVAKSLVPVLDRACVREIEVDLVDVFERLVFDIICLLVLGFDPKCLSEEFPEVPYEKAFNDMGEAILHRHVVPEKYWKLMRLLRIGKEKKLDAASKIFDDFMYECISLKRETCQRQMSGNFLREENGLDFLSFLFKEEEEESLENKFLRDATTSMIAAGRDTSSATLSWFFWLVATNKSVEKNILEEIKNNLQMLENPERIHIFSSKEINKLVYLHATLCETLRLYPPVPINYKCSALPDTLPTGHRIKANTKLFVSFYAMGRMKGVWGEDCLDFKPERWISGRGGILHVPSYKFSAFNAGPRICMGKNMSFVQMKMVAATIILNYRVRVVEGSVIFPSVSAILHVRDGLKVRVSRRE